MEYARKRTWSMERTDEEDEKGSGHQEVGRIEQILINIFPLSEVATICALNCSVFRQKIGLQTF